MATKRKKIVGWGLLIVLLALVIYYFYPESPFPKDKMIDRIEVYKSKDILLAYSKGVLIKKYTVSTGVNPDGQKQYEGDGKTPEGLYTINDKNPNSAFHKNLGISYPNKEDAARAKRLGKPAGEIKIHGMKNGLAFVGKFHRWIDWTNGCIALTDGEVDELYEHTAVGTPIEIKP
jgi:murein L,D-transpeptidase YafK